MINIVLYQLAIHAYKAAILIASPFNKKAKAWLSGRTKNAYEHFFGSLNGAPVIWMHASSLGEYEQGRPVLDALYLKFPEHQFVVSFFSPSGYEVVAAQSNYFSCVYLPLDTPKNALEFVTKLKPEIVIWIKYDYWYFMLQALFKNKVKVYLVSALFLKSQPFFKWYGSIQRKCLTFFKTIFVQNEASKNLIHGVNNKLPVIVSGDTRYARVVEIANNVFDNEIIEKFANLRPTIICGSTWAEDIELLKSANLTDNFNLLIAPHNITTANINFVKTNFPNSILYSEIGIDKKISNINQVLILDTVGMLSKIYRFGFAAFIGGGFSKTGIHNILEPAAYNIPVLFGPNYKKYNEAVEMLAADACICVNNASELNKNLQKLKTNNFFYNELVNNSKIMVNNNLGAVSIILKTFV